MLRHSLGLLAGLLVAPLLWLGTAWTAAEFGERVTSLSLNDPLLLSAAAAVMVIGLLCGLLAGSRVSPLAAFLPGAALLGLGLWPLVNYAAMDATLPDWLGSESMFYPVGPALPMNIALGTMLIASALAPSRWRSRSRRDHAVSAPLPRSESPDSEEPRTVSPVRPLTDIENPEKTTVPFRRG